jgi:hypothetical protein
MIHSWRANYHHGCGLLRQPRRYCGRHKRCITPLDDLLHDAGSSPTQLCHNRRHQPSRPAWRDNKIIHSPCDRSLLGEFHGPEEPVDVQAKTG